MATGELTWSDVTYELHGLTREDGPPDIAGAINSYHEDDRPKVQQAVTEAIETAEARSGAGRLLNVSTGNYSDVEFEIYPVFDNGGELIWIAGVIRLVPT